MESGKKDIKELWLRYVEERATPEEINELFASLKNAELEEEHTTLAQQAAMLAGTGLTPDAEQQAAVWQQLLQQAEGLKTSPDPATLQPVRSIHFLRKWSWAAAIIIVTLGVGTYFFTTNKKNATTPPVALTPVDIAPGKNGAILTLADGTQVLLDSLGNGIIATENGAQILLNDNSVSYKQDATNGKEIVYNTMSTPKGRQFRVSLPDGTQVWLNSASSLRYPTVFSGKERKITLTGEGYFEVAKNKKMPFKVNINNKAEVEVLGTQFNVNAYDNEKSIAATLLEGSIKVAKGKESSTIKPGEQVQVTERISTPQKADLEKVMAWKNNLFNFENAKLDEIMRQLERWYDIDVVYEKGVPNVALTGEITRGVTLNELLTALEKLGVRYKREGRKLTIFP